MLENKIPEIDNEFFCIVNSENPILSALVSSYLYKKDKYLPMFDFSTVTKENDQLDKGRDNENIDEHHISRTRASDFNIKIKNTLNRIGGCDCLILVGLSDEQKSYLSFLNDYNIIDITDISDVETYLKYTSNKSGYIKCKSNDLYNGLYFASMTNSFLKIDENAEDIIIDKDKNGLIVIEDVNNSSVVIAVNYALSVDANVEIISPPTISKREIKNLIEDWQNGNENSFNDLSASIYNNIQYIDFKKYNYCTFFTIGAPYSLILKNIIPFTHVHIYLNPDFFIFNNLYYENRDGIKSSIVFSPLAFIDEETNYVITKLRDNNYYVKELIGKEASVHNIDYHVKEYPFDLLHICSHGGEVSGFSIKEQFMDSNGEKHIVEYDEVVSFAPTHGEELIPVTSKYIWRKFNSYEWGSKEFKNQKYPHYLFSDMINAIYKNEKKDRIRKDIVPNSCAIKCHDFNYQATFNTFSSSTAPIIFNNTCWSWGYISHSFLAVGARAYIGTLWEVNNTIAKKTAESFYSELFKISILESLQYSLSNTHGTDNENIYMLWGLHFTSLNSGISIEQSKKNIAKSLLLSLNEWKRKLKTSDDKFSIDSISRIIRWNATQISNYFQKEALQIMVVNRRKTNQNEENI